MAVWDQVAGWLPGVAALATSLGLSRLPGALLENRRRARISQTLVLLKEGTILPAEAREQLQQCLVEDAKVLRALTATKPWGRVIINATVGVALVIGAAVAVVVLPSRAGWPNAILGAGALVISAAYLFVAAERRHSYDELNPPALRWWHARRRAVTWMVEKVPTVRWLAWASLDAAKERKRKRVEAKQAERPDGSASGAVA